MPSALAGEGEPVWASKAADDQQGRGAGPNQEQRERTEIIFKQKYTLCVHDAPLHPIDRLCQSLPRQRLSCR
jgi:hypothetical protein